VAKESNRILKEIEDKFGEGILVNGSSILDKKKRVVPVSPTINIILSGGIPEGSFVTIGGFPKRGKAQPMYSLIQTPNGPKTMSEIKTNDIVCHPDGTLSTVIGIFHQGIKPIYRIHFKGGDFVDACGEHLWSVEDRDKKLLLSTQDIINRFVKCQDNRFFIQLTQPLHYYSKDVLIEPYLLGLLIGDGNITDTIRFTTTDKELLDSIKDKLIDGYQIKPVSSVKTGIDYRIVKNKRNSNSNYYKESLKVYKLYGKNSKDKFIPNEYKYNSYDVRLAVIQGLMDTDGTCSTDGRATYYTSSYQLALDFKELINSIGGICSIADKYTKCNGKQFKSYRCCIRISDPSILFRLERKKSRAKERTRYLLRKSIKKIEHIGNFECQCIKVDREDGLYLTDNCTITHNTTLALQFAKNWQLVDDNHEVYFGNVEHRLKEMNIKSCIGLDMDRFHVIQSTKDKILSAQDFLNIFSSILKTQPNTLIIVDSFAMLSEEREQVGGVGTETRGGGNKLLSQFFREVAPIVPINESVVMGITHMMANTSGYGKKTTEKGGFGVAYQADVKLMADSEDLWTSTGEENGTLIGKKVTWLCEVSALGPPYGEAIGYHRFGKGIDEVMESIVVACDLGLITKKSSWFRPVFLGEAEGDQLKVNGANNLYEFIQSNPEYKKKLLSDIQKLLGAT
jgi:RecA/RadA recombinase